MNDEKIDLTKYQYDIETVEMLASTAPGAKPVSTTEDPEKIRAEKREFLVESSVRTFDKDMYIG